MPLAANKQTLSSRLGQEIGSILKKKSCNRSRLRSKSVVAEKSIESISKRSIDEKEAHKLNYDMNFNRSKLNSSV